MPTILLVEDNPDDEELTRIAFEESNLANQLVVAHDGVEALEYLLDPKRPLPQMVLLDLKLPKLNGLEVLRRLRADERTKFLPIVILTSSDEERDRTQSYGFGANSYVRKPMDFQQFQRAVSELGLYWLDVNQPPLGPGGSDLSWARP